MLKSLIALILSIAASVFCLGNRVYSSDDVESATSVKEQALFSGFYPQSSLKGDGDPVSMPNMSDGYLKFDIGSRETSFINWYLTEESIISNQLYSKEMEGFNPNVSFNPNKYFENDEMKSDVQVGPKTNYLSSTCKIRAYYRDVRTFFGLVTVMYDFTGFLVGESLLMTAAHGLYLDVTTGPFDDGITNYYFPGKIEVYGAIGLVDDWGEAYPYYSLCNEIYFDTDYITSRTINNDWALLRLQKPLGRFLSKRTLIVNSPSCERLDVVGYPSWNQEYQRQPATNCSVLSAYGQFSYGTTTFEGMSGSPLCLPESAFFSQEGSYAWIYDSNGRPCLQQRCAFGMHISYDYSNGIGFGLRFTNDMLDLVNALNSKYRPSSISVSEMAGAQIASGDQIAFSDDYHCNVTLSECSFLNGSLFFESTSGYAVLDFNFPVSGVSLFASPLTGYNYGLAEARYVDANGLYRYIVVNSGTNNCRFENQANRIIIYANRTGVTIEDIELRPDWNCYFADNSHPSYNRNEIARTSDNNCVSYALGNLTQRPYPEDNYKGIVPVDEANNITVGMGIKGNPNYIVSELKRELESRHSLRMVEIEKYGICSNGGHKIAVLCDPFGYYHVSRLNSEGFWSHFFYGQGIYSIDSLGASITNIETAVFCNGPSATEAINNSDPANRPMLESPFDLTSLVGCFEVYRL